MDFYGIVRIHTKHVLLTAYPMLSEYHDQVSLGEYGEFCGGSLGLWDLGILGIVLNLSTIYSGMNFFVHERGGYKQLTRNADLNGY